MTQTIGSSDAPKILGLSTYGGPWSVWPELVGLIPRYSGSSGADAQRGHRMEPVILDWYAEEQGLAVEQGESIEHAAPTRDGWAHSHPDGRAGSWMLTDSGPRGLATVLVPERIVEAKSLRWFDDRWGASGTDQVRLDYLVQCWHHRFVFDLPVDLVAFAIGSSEMRTYRIDPPPELLARQVEMLHAWWQRHVRDGHPPPIDADRACATGLGMHHKYAGGKTYRDATGLEVEIAQELADVSEQIKTLAAQQCLLQNTLRDGIGTDYGLKHGGRTLAQVSRAAGRRTAQVKDIEALRTLIEGARSVHDDNAGDADLLTSAAFDQLIGHRDPFDLDTLIKTGSPSTRFKLYPDALDDEGGS